MTERKGRKKDEQKERKRRRVGEEGKGRKKPKQIHTFPCSGALMNFRQTYSTGPPPWTNPTK